MTFKTGKAAEAIKRGQQLADVREATFTWWHGHRQEEAPEEIGLVTQYVRHEFPLCDVTDFAIRKWVYKWRWKAAKGLGLGKVAAPPRRLKPPVLTMADIQRACIDAFEKAGLYDGLQVCCDELKASNSKLKAEVDVLRKKITSQEDLERQFTAAQRSVVSGD